MFPLSVDRKVRIEYDHLTSQRKTCTELIRSRKPHLAIAVNATRWPVTHPSEKHWSAFAFFLSFFFRSFFFNLSYNYSKMKAIMGKIHRGSPTVKPTGNSQETEIKIRVPMETGIKKVCSSPLVIQVNVISEQIFWKWLLRGQCLSFYRWENNNPERLVDFFF